MEMVEHFVHVLAQPKQGRAEIIFHAPLKIGDFADRKALTQAAYQAVADGMPNRLPISRIVGEMPRWDTCSVMN